MRSKVRAIKKPTVTICVPAYNAERTLARTLDSLVAQDYECYSIVVCDNASTDRTAEITADYARQGVKYVLNPKPSVLAEANWNYALTAAEGDFVALYHADDIYHPQIVRRQVEYFPSHPDAVAVFTMTQFIDDRDRPIRLGRTRIPGPLKGKSEYSFSDLFVGVLQYGNFLNVPTMMAHRETLIRESGPFDLKYKSAADIDLYLRLSKTGLVGVIDETMHYYRITDSQASADINRARTEKGDFFRVINDYLLTSDVEIPGIRNAIAYYRGLEAIDTGYCGMNLLAKGDVVAARKKLDEIAWWQLGFKVIFRPGKLVRIGAVASLRLSLAVGFGMWAGRTVRAAHRMSLLWRRGEAN